MEKLVTILSFDSPALAHVARSRLEHEGIPCFITDEYLVGVQWLYANAIGGVKIQVPESMAEEALALLSEGYSPESMDVTDSSLDDDTMQGFLEPDPVCPRCGSIDIDTLSPNRLFMIFKIPVKFSSRLCRCRACKHTWKTSRS